MKKKEVAAAEKSIVIRLRRRRPNIVIRSSPYILSQRGRKTFHTHEGYITGLPTTSANTYDWS